MRISGLTVNCAIAVAVAVATPAAAQTFADRIVPGFEWPADATHAPGDPTRLFVVEVWHGRIGVVDLSTRTVLPDPFLSITDLPNPLGNEQGLLGLTFDPDFAANGHFYVNYTGADNSLNVVRYRVLGDPATSNVVDMESRYPILKMPKADNWHNGGWIDFSPNDGYLYISIGDPHNVNAQDITDNWHGKILRIDVRGDDFPDDEFRNFAIPPTNPFVGKEGDDEIWAYGLRNPWRASFDRVTGDLWINDVGDNTREEVNFQPASSNGGANYAWPRREGTVDGIFENDVERLPGDVEPVYDYPRTGPDPLYTGTTIAGSGLYRGSVDAFYGHYFFSDHGSMNIWKLDPDAVDLRASVTNVNHLLMPNEGFISRIVSFGEDAHGELYLVNFNGGGIYRIATTSADTVWNGDDDNWGQAGNGTAWGSSLNWTRGDEPDKSFVTSDNVIFSAGATQEHVYLGRNRTVAAIEFQAPFTLHDHTLRVLSGNVTVEDGITATIVSTLVAETVNHSIRKLGAGTLVVEGNAGQIAVKEGTLAGTGSLDYLTVRSGATVAPGASLGVLTVRNSLRMESGARLAIEIAGYDNTNADAPQFDQLIVEGAAMLAGILDVALTDLDGDSYVPALGDVFSLVYAMGGITGWFDTINLPALPYDQRWKLESDGTMLALSVVDRLPGDYNGDGTVDAADYLVWRGHAGQTGFGSPGDGTGRGGKPDGYVNQLDYLLWRSNFGATDEGKTPGPALAVPGPLSIQLVLIGLGMLLARGRRAE